MHILAKTQKAQEIRERILELVEQGNKNPVSQVAEERSLTRQTISAHVRELVKTGFLLTKGKSRDRVYYLGNNIYKKRCYQLNQITEDRVFREDFAGLLRDHHPDTIQEICHYGFTEIVNNAIDHSEGQEICISLRVMDSRIHWSVKDDGEGIFKHIKRLLNLYDEREALLELSKGKLTTDPDKHTGEGIFFTSRAFDEFYIVSGELAFTHDSNAQEDWLLHEKQNFSGTEVIMKINSDSKKVLGDIFDEFSTAPDEYAFDKTIVPVRLALYEGEKLVSRSQAKRLLARIERFRRVIFDFEQVESVGQAFADEVFRVFQKQHPEIDLQAINISESINKMISRAKAI